MSSASVAITGLGSVSPLGMDTPAMWQAICAGQSGIGPIRSFDPVGFDCKIAGQVGDYKIRDFVPKKYRKATKLMCRDIEFAVIAAKEAFASAGHTTKGTDDGDITINPVRTAVEMGAGLISCDLEEMAPAVAASLTDGKFDIRKWGHEGLPQVTPLWLLKYLPNMLACHVGIIHDLQGPSNTITCAEVSGHLAIAEAAEMIIRGDSDMAVAGAGESKLNPVVMARQSLLQRCSVRNDSPEQACRPFDADACGAVFGEAAAAVLLEKVEDAKSRQAKIFAELVGIGQSTSLDPRYKHLEPDGKAVTIAVERALDDAEITPDELDLIIPHGTGVAQDDLAEAKGIQAALGSAVKDIPVLPTKSMLSNTGAACGAIDVVVAAMAMSENKIPAAINFEKHPAGCELNINTREVDAEIRYALCCGYTPGGQTAAIVLKNPTV